MKSAQQITPTAAISNEMVRLFARYFGRGPTKARTTLTTNLCVVSMADAMTRAEQNLVDAGEPEAVRGMRSTLHRAMRDDAVGAVESILRRPVVAYLFDIDTDANISVVVFILAPDWQNRLEVVELDDQHADD